MMWKIIILQIQASQNSSIEDLKKMQAAATGTTKIGKVRVGGYTEAKRRGI